MQKNHTIAMVQLPAKSVCVLWRKQLIMCLTLDFNLGPQIPKVGTNRGQLRDCFKLCPESICIGCSGPEQFGTPGSVTTTKCRKITRSQWSNSRQNLSARCGENGRL